MKVQNNIYLNRRFNCPASELFEWLVQAELIAKWFGPQGFSVKTAQTAVAVGGKYSIELVKHDQTGFTVKGEYIKVNRPRNLEFSLYYEGLANKPPKSIVSIQLIELSPRESELIFSQKFEFTPSDIENRAAAWEYMFGVLKEQIKI